MARGDDKFRVIMPGRKAQEIRERAGAFLGVSFVLGSVGLGVAVSSNGSFQLGVAMLILAVGFLGLFGATWDLQYKRVSDAPPSPGLPRWRLAAAGACMAGLVALLLLSPMVSNPALYCVIPMMTLVLVVHLLLKGNPNGTRAAEK